MRIFAISDLHADFEANQKWIDSLSSVDYTEDTLILAGDITDNLHQLQQIFYNLRQKFANVFFVPGNHDLWIRRNECAHSIEKFNLILNCCSESGIKIKPAKLHSNSIANAVWIVPLFSWYTKPEEGDDSLYLHKPGEDTAMRMWSDQYFIIWPQNQNGYRPSDYFLQMNEQYLNKKFDAPVITFSHFIPREEMMFSEYPPVFDPEKIRKYDRNPQFNFSSVAGSSLIDKQIRRIGSIIHIYGHQHRNRDRVIEGVRYISHCLGYPNERIRGSIEGIEQGIKLIWDTKETIKGS